MNYSKALKKLMSNERHWLPGQTCPICKKGTIIRVGLLIEQESEELPPVMLDGVMCNECLTTGNKCAKDKGEGACLCEKGFLAFVPEQNETNKN